MRVASFPLAVIVYLAMAVCAASSHAEIVIQDLFNSSGTDYTRAIFSSINDAGQVGFITRDSSGHERVFRREIDGSNTILFDTAETYSGLAIQGGQFLTGGRLDSNGNIAFSRDLTTGTGFRRDAVTVAGNGGVADILNRSGTSGLHQFFVRGFNDSGTVAFRAESTQGSNQHYEGAYIVDSAGNVSTVNDHVYSTNSNRTQIPDINNAGTVAVQSVYPVEQPNGSTQSRLSMLKGTPGDLEVVNEGFLDFARPSDINNKGDLAYVENFGSLIDGQYVNQDRLRFLADGSDTSLTLLSPENFDIYDALVGLNDLNQVAIMGNDGMGTGLFTSTDLETFDPVIRVGDSLFGSQVTSLHYDGAINNSGQMVFQYGLADGSFGIASAVSAVPEPSSLGLMSASLAVAAFFRRRKGRARKSTY